MGKRTTFMKVSQDEAHIISGAWAAHPKIKKEVTDHLIFGSDGSHSEPHSLALALYDFAADLLSEPKSVLPMDDGLRPRTIAVHPGGEGVVVSFETGCKLFTWEDPSEAKIKSTKEVEMKLKPSETVLSGLEDVGPQNCLLFNGDGSLLASGGEDGCIRVFWWRSMEVLLNLPKAYKSIKDLDFSLDSAFLSATADNSPCRIWDLSTSENVATLQPLAGETFGFSRFSRSARKAFLFVSVTKDKKGYVGVWDLFKWNRIGAKKFLAEPISSFAITHHGKRLAMGTRRGDIYIIETEKMQVEQSFKSAHIRDVASLEFSLNDKALLSLSSDYSSRVTALDLSKEWKEWQIYLVLIGLILASMVLFYMLFLFGDSFYSFPDGQNQTSSAPKHEEL